MSFRKRYLAATATLALAAGTALPAWSGTLEDDVLIDTSGDGLIFSDPAEGVLDPGIRAITFTSTRIGSGEDAVFVDPFENIVTDYTTLSNRGEAPNCLIANNPSVFCDSERGSGKRIKTWLTGRNPFEMRLATTPSDLHPTVDYFTFGKTSNYTGARITGFSIELRDADGNLMGDRDAAEAVLFNLDPALHRSLLSSANLPDGLFGRGGNEGEIGFFSEQQAILNLDASSDVLDFGGTGDLFAANAFHTDNFGTAFLDDSMVPDGLFWDDNDNPDDEAALIAWNNIANGGWTYGILETAANLDARLAELADALGVSVADLQYADGARVPDAIVAAAESSGLFAVDRIEDLRNANLNFTITVGNVEDGEFTLRIVPRFAPIVSETATPYQFAVAASLDAANVPYLGADPAYLAAIDNALALDRAAQNQALERLGYSFLAAYPGLAFSTAQEQVLAIRAGSDPDAAAAEVAQDNSWFSLGSEGARGLVALSGGIGDVGRTTNGIGYDFTVANLSAGLEFPVREGLSAGVLAGIARADADIDDARGSLDQQALSFAVFGRGQFADAGSFEAIAGYQSLSFDSTRRINAAGVSETATASTDGSVLFAAVSGDYMYSRGAMSFGPAGSFEIYDVSVDGFTETGAGAFNIEVGDQDNSLVVARLGVRAEGEYATAAGSFRPYGLLGWASRSGDDAVIPTSFGGVLPGITPVDGSDASWLDIGLGFTVEAGRRGDTVTSFGADYRGAIGNDYESHSARVFVEISF